jgi:hypothetical protein
MSDLENRNVNMGDSAELRQQCASLQRQVTTLLLAVFVLSGTVTVFLWRQARYARKDLEVLKPPAAQIIQSFKQEKPIMDDFVAKLAEFGKTHPDFMPIVNKYKIQPVTAPGITSTPPAVIAPKTVPAPSSTTPKQ